MPSLLRSYATAQEACARDISYTLACHRSQLAKRGYLLVSQKTLTQDLLDKPFHTSSGADTRDHQPVFVYTGQGAQWRSMGQQLLQHVASARETIKLLDGYLQNIPEHRPNWSLLQSLDQPDTSIDVSEPQLAQTLTTAVQLALTDLLFATGIRMFASVGHSSGEIGAAYAAGLLFAKQAILAAYCRGLVAARAKSNGMMLAVAQPPTQTQTQIAELSLQGSATVACFNSPESTTVSGDAHAVKQLQSFLDASGVWNRPLRTAGRAYHSHHLKEVSSEYETLLANLWKGVDDSRRNATVYMVSTVTGDYVDQTMSARPNYWCKNMESPVRFDLAVGVILERQKSIHFVEIGPHPALKAPIQQIARSLGS